MGLRFQEEESRKEERREDGSVLLVALVTLSALLMTANITVLKVSRGTQVAAQSRFASVALFAAESGISVGMDFLRLRGKSPAHYSALVSPSNHAPQTPVGMAGNTRRASHVDSLFSGDLEMRYDVSVLNNIADPSFSVGGDSDGIVILRSIGHGPGLSRVIIEVSVDGSVAGPLQVGNWRIVN